MPLTRTPMKRTAKPTGPHRDVVEAVLERDQHSCVVCAENLHGTRGRDWSIHHRRPRGMGGTHWAGSNGLANLMLVCGSGTTGCHGVIESHRAGAIEGGWLVLSSTDPATVALLIKRDRWCYLTADGRYSDDPPAVASRG
jgi:hypothetical protein